MFYINFKDDTSASIKFGIPTSYDGRKKISLQCYFGTNDHATKTLDDLEKKSRAKLLYWVRHIAKGYRHKSSKKLNREIESRTQSSIWSFVLSFK